MVSEALSGTVRLSPETLLFAEFQHAASRVVGKTLEFVAKPSHARERAQSHAIQIKRRTGRERDCPLDNLQRQRIAPFRIIFEP